MGVITIWGRTAVTSGNLDGTAKVMVDDKNQNTRSSTLALLRTKMFAGGTGFTAADPLTVGAITGTTVQLKQTGNTVAGGFRTIRSDTTDFYDIYVGGDNNLYFQFNGVGFTRFSSSGGLTTSAGITVTAGGITSSAGTNTFAGLVNLNGGWKYTGAFGDSVMDTATSLLNELPAFRYEIYSESANLCLFANSQSNTLLLGYLSGTFGYCSAVEVTGVASGRSRLSLMKGGGNINMAGLPTSASGLSTGDLWNNAGVVTVA